MARRKTGWNPDYIREKIQTSQLVNRLQGHAMGKVKMEPTQVAAALGVLKKTLPDLAAIQHSGDASAPFVLTIAAPEVDD